MNFSQKLCFLMDSQKISAYKMSKDTGISDRLIGYWRKGEKLPNAENLIIIANYFNTPIDELLGRTDNKNGYSNNNINNSDNFAFGENAQVGTCVDGMEKEMIEEFKKLTFTDKVKVINLIAELNQKGT